MPPCFLIPNILNDIYVLYLYQFCQGLQKGKKGYIATGEIDNFGYRDSHRYVSVYLAKLLLFRPDVTRCV